MHPFEGRDVERQRERGGASRSVDRSILARVGLHAAQFSVSLFPGPLSRRAELAGIILDPIAAGGHAVTLTSNRLHRVTWTAHHRPESPVRRSGAGSGFGLIEILVALAILTMAFLPILSMSSQGNRSAKHSELSVQATLRATSILDRAAARPWQELLAAATGSGSVPVSTTVSSPSFGEDLTCELTPEGVLVLGVSVSFQLPGAGRQPRRTINFHRVVGRPDLSVVMPAQPESV